MALNILSSQSRFTFRLLSCPVETSLVNFGVHETLSGTFSESVLLATAEEIKSFDSIIGGEALLTVVNNDPLSGEDRYVHGVVRKCEYSGRSGNQYLYEAEIVPSIFFLSQRSNCRIFQETTTQEIIQTILKEARITSDRYRFILKNTDRKRGFCVQYRESDLDFISRLMEEEGIFYFFEHYRDRHVLVMGDHWAVHAPIKGEPAITCNSGDGLVADRESVQHFTFSQRRTPEAFAHGNFFFKRPDLDLTSKWAEAKNHYYEIYDYAALHTTQAHGEQLAKARLEQLVSLQKQGHGQSSSCRLTPGYLVTLTDHDTESLNAEYLLVQVSHSGSQPQVLGEQAGGDASYSNIFTVIPARTQYRPPLITPRPVVSGLQTAIVVGPKGEEIHTDDYGRVKVQFHWDREGQRNDRSSCWLRVAQAWGGLSRGGQFIPRIGDEVLVDFLEGNPDRPIVTGSVYNGDNQPINSLKKSVTQSGFKTRTHKGDGFHELRFDDAKGKEEIFLHSQKDMNLVVKDRKGQTICGDCSTLILKNNEQKVEGNDFRYVMGKKTEIAHEIIVTSDTTLTLKSGGSFIEISPETIKIKSNIVKVNCNDEARQAQTQPVSGAGTWPGSGGGTWPGSSSGGGRWPSGGMNQWPGSGGGTLPIASPSATSAPKAAATPSRNETSLESFKGTIPSGGWAGVPSGSSLPAGPLAGSSSLPGDLVATGSPSPLLPGAANSGLGDLVSPNSSPLDNVAGLYEQTVGQSRSGVAKALDRARDSALKKAGLGNMGNKVGVMSEKPTGVLGGGKVNPDDLIKTF